MPTNTRKKSSTKLSATLYYKEFEALESVFARLKTQNALDELTMLWLELHTGGFRQESELLGRLALHYQFVDYVFCLILRQQAPSAQLRFQASWLALMLRAQAADYFKLKKIRPGTWPNLRQQVIKALKTRHAPATIVRLLVAEEQLALAIEVAGKERASWLLIKEAYPQVVKSLPRGSQAEAPLPETHRPLPLPPAGRAAYLPFEDARLRVQAQKFKNQGQYLAWILRAQPRRLPTWPQKIYRGKGWCGWRDFLGLDGAASPGRKQLDFAGKRPGRSNFRPFKQAREHIRALGLASSSQYASWAKSSARPEDIPRAPDQVYKGQGWINWYDWLGKSEPPTFKSFEQAREYVRAQGFANQIAYQAWARSSARPEDIPANPCGTYAQRGWVNWPDWLGKPVRCFLDFETLRQRVQAANVSSGSAFERWRQRQNDYRQIPKCPEKVYAEHWQSWYHFLGKNAPLGPKPRQPPLPGTLQIKPGGRRFLPFEQARQLMRELGIKDSQQFRVWLRTPERHLGIPASPNEVYQNSGWISWMDFFGNSNTTSKSGSFRPFEQAREYVRNLGFINYKAYQQWAGSGQRPLDIPFNPDRAYHQLGWKGWRDYLKST